MGKPSPSYPSVSKNSPNKKAKACDGKDEDGAFHGHISFARSYMDMATMTNMNSHMSKKQPDLIAVFP